MKGAEWSGMSSWLQACWLDMSKCQTAKPLQAAPALENCIRTGKAGYSSATVVVWFQGRVDENGLAGGYRSMRLMSRWYACATWHNRLSHHRQKCSALRLALILKSPSRLPPSWSRVLRSSLWHWFTSILLQRTDITSIPDKLFPHTHTHRHCDCEEEVGMLSCHSYLLILALLLVGGGCSDSLLTLEAATQQMVWWGMNECSWNLLTTFWTLRTQKSSGLSSETDNVLKTWGGKTTSRIFMSIVYIRVYIVSIIWNIYTHSFDCLWWLSI